MEIEYERLEFLLCTNIKERNIGKMTFTWGLQTFLGSNQAWVHGFCRLGHGSATWVLGFTSSWVRQLGSPVRGFAAASCGFSFNLFFCFFGCHGFFFFFFQRGGFFSKEEEGETKLFGFLLWNLSVQNSISRWIFIEIKYVILDLLQWSQVP